MTVLRLHAAWPERHAERSRIFCHTERSGFFVTLSGVVFFVTLSGVEVDIWNDFCTKFASNA
jgi:hypothetical protein